MRVPEYPVSEAIASILEDNNINRYKARRAQAKRRADRVVGAGQRAPGGTSTHRSATRQDVHNVVPPVPGRWRRSVRVAAPMPWFLLVGVGGLTFVGLLALIGGIAVWRWIWP